MASAPWYANVNVADFSQLLYRPLFWFGDDGQPVFNPALSVAYAPKWSDRNQTLTVRLKHWIWSDGEPITARDVVFWMNLLVAAVSPQAASVGSSSAPGPGYGAYVPGEFPDNVASYRQTGTYTLVFHLDSSYNPTWFLYNELSQITPVPQHVWDKLSATGVVGNYDEQGIGTATSGALGVAQFINSQSEDAGTYTIDPLLEGRQRTLQVGAVYLGRVRQDGAQRQVLGTGQGQNHSLRGDPVHQRRGRVR